MRNRLSSEDLRVVDQTLADLRVARETLAGVDARRYLGDSEARFLLAEVREKLRLASAELRQVRRLEWTL